MSGPLLDRLDVHVGVPPVEIGALVGGVAGESSERVRARVSAARARQTERKRRGEVNAPTNATLSASELERVAALPADARSMLEAAMTQLGLSARAFVRVLRVARTIADLEGCQAVGREHVAEAIQGRLLDREAAL